MNTKVIIGVLAGVILVGGGVYFVNQGNSTSAEGAASSEASTATATTAAPMSLKDLIAQGVSEKCDFSDSDATSGAQTQGTMYVADGKVRGDFTATVQGKAMGTHMISDGTTMYTWIDGMGSGFKMSMTAVAKPTDTAAPQQQHGFDSNKKVDYHCTPGSVDATVFTLPTSITFQDMSAMMHAAMPKVNATGGASVQGTAPAGACNACEQLAGEGRAACRAALHC